MNSHCSKQRLSRYGFVTAFAFVVAIRTAAAQLAPEMGYVYPPGGKAGTTVEIRLGGYDWTPDLQYFVHDPRIKLEILGPPGEMLVPGPPYWFGPKARGGAFPIPREVAARLTIPADMPEGVVFWQVANANGASAAGKFSVGHENEIRESRRRDEPQLVRQLPVTISGRLERIQEVDCYRIRAAQSGPIHCELFAKRLGSPFNGILAVYDADGQRIRDAADTTGNDTALTFAAEAEREYDVKVYDLDFRGNRSFVYRLRINNGPQIIAAIPAVGQRGTTGQVRFFGYGVAGGAKLESVTREVTFPSDPRMESLGYRVQTPHGTAMPFRLPLSDDPQAVAPTDATVSPALAVPSGVTDTLATDANDKRYRVSGKKDDVWSISLGACGSESLLDPVLAVYGPDGKELAKNDDLAGTNDAGLVFTVPVDGEYQLAVSSLSGASSATSAIYHLSVAKPRRDFSISGPERLAVVIGAEKTELAVKAVRSGGFQGPILLKVSGLPEGLSAPDELVIPADKSELKIPLESSKDAPATASLATITATSEVDESNVTRVAGPLLVAHTMKPRAKVTPVDREGGRTVHRGTTFPAPVIIERLEGFDGEVLLEMTARQSRHRQGIRGPEMVVPTGTTRIDYPVFMPEWLETSRTSRMILNAVTKVPDPQGNLRYLSSKMDGRITMSLEGALLKIAHQAKELQLRPGESFDIPITVSRSAKLPVAAVVELVAGPELERLLTAAPVEVEPQQNQAALHVTSSSGARLQGDYRFIVRATALQQGRYPVISETQVDVEFVAVK